MGIIVFESFATRILKKDGTEPGYTGSPGDSLKNCTACHGGNPITIEGWVTSNIPVDGYIPGETYTIKATNKEIGGTRFGFEVSPQALNGNLLGTLIITDTGRTKLVGDQKYVTYRAAGVEGIDSLSWSFDWVAPTAGTGEVTFYGAFNSNYEGHKDGDKTYLSTLTVNQNPASTIQDVSARIASFRAFPNPSMDYINVTFDLITPGHVTLDIVDLTGKRIILITDGKESGAFSERINTSGITKGVYMIRLQVDGKMATQKISIGR